MTTQEKKDSSKKKKTPAGLTYAEILLDKSGSMGGARQSVIDGTNEYLNGLRQDKKKLVEATRVSITAFDSVGFGGSEVRIKVIHDNVKLADARSITADDYQPEGGTPLYDAVGRTIHRLDPLITSQDKVVVMVYTDGHENSSSEYSREQVLAMIEERQGRGNWTFVYIGSDPRAAQHAAAIGIRAGNYRGVTTTDSANVAASFAAMASSTRHMRGGQQMSSVAYFSDAGEESGDGARSQPAEGLFQNTGGAFGGTLPPKAPVRRGARRKTEPTSGNLSDRL